MEENTMEIIHLICLIILLAMITVWLMDSLTKEEIFICIQAKAIATINLILWLSNQAKRKLVRSMDYLLESLAPLK